MKKLYIITITLISCWSYAGEINYYGINTTPGYEVYEYVDNCKGSHKISIKKDDFNQKTLSDWLEKILKITTSYGC